MNCESQLPHMTKTSTNLYNLFADSVSRFGPTKCVVSVKNSQTVTFSYDDVHHQVQNLSESFIFSIQYFVGIIGDELTAEIIVCILGILKSGGAFVFLKSTQYESIRTSIQKLRVRYIIGRNSVVRGFLTEQEDGQFDIIKTVTIFGEEFTVIRGQTNFEDIAVSDDFYFAFAVFSSGSTKRIPKIIKVPHRCIVPNILDLSKLYRLKSSDKIYISTPLTFDPCIHDIFLAFSSGCCILLVDSILKHEPQCIRMLFSPQGHNVTVFFSTPSLFRKYLPQIGPCSLRILTLGGEPFPPIKQLLDAFTHRIQIYNIYGITEVSCWASVVRVRQCFEGFIPLGSLLSDTIFEVRAESGRVIDNGIGELFIGSTNRVCVVNDDFEFTKLRPCFRASGDLVKVSTGQFYYIGRKDRRMKLLGHQVDLSRIENKITLHSSVKYCLALIDGIQIIALVELNTFANSDVSPKSLREFASRDLPSYMLPHDIHIVSELPLNSHGKISSFDCDELYQRLKQPQNIDLQFRDLWSKYTNQSSSNPNCGFLDSGGNSFAALQLNSALEERFTDVPRNLVEFLVTNKPFSDCLRLINSNNNDMSSSSVVVNKKRKNETEISGSFKTTKSNNTSTCVLYKGHNLRFGDFLSGISKMNIEWRYNLEKCVDASPTVLVSADRAIAICGAHSGHLVIIEVVTGTVISKVKLPDRIESSACVFGEEHRLFIGCYDGKMYAIDIISGSIVWSFKTYDIIKSTAVLFNHLLFFGSYDHNFYCISNLDGTLSWKVNIDDSAIYTTAIVRNDVIISATLAGTVAFIDHNGAVIRKVDDLKPIFSNPAEIPDENIFIVIDVAGSVRCFDLHSHCEVWRDSVCGNVFSSLSVLGSGPVKKIVFGSQDGKVICLQVSRSVKRKMWESTIGEQAYSTPFGCETWASVVAASTDGRIHILDADSGKTLTSYSIEAPVFSSPIAYGTYIVVGCRDNHLYCLSVCYK